MIQYFLTKFDSDSFLNTKEKIADYCAPRDIWICRPTCYQPLELLVGDVPETRRGLVGHPACRFSGWISMTRTCLIQDINFYELYVKQALTGLQTLLNSIFLWWHLIQTYKNKFEPTNK